MATPSRMRNRDRLLKKMAALPAQVRSEIKQAIAQGADELVAAQKALVPVKTGNLRESITQTWGGNRQDYASLSAGGVQGGDPDLTVIVSAGDSDARYAHLVEFGTAPHVLGGLFTGAMHPGSRARPFFFPPFRAMRKRLKSRVSRATTRAAKKVAAGS